MLITVSQSFQCIHMSQVYSSLYSIQIGTCLALKFNAASICQSITSYRWSRCCSRVSEYTMVPLMYTLTKFALFFGLRSINIFCIRYWTTTGALIRLNGIIRICEALVVLHMQVFLLSQDGFKNLEIPLFHQVWMLLYCMYVLSVSSIFSKSFPTVSNFLNTPLSIRNSAGTPYIK